MVGSGISRRKNDAVPLPRSAKLSHLDQGRLGPLHLRQLPSPAVARSAATRAERPLTRSCGHDFLEIALLSMARLRTSSPAPPCGAVIENDLPWRIATPHLRQPNYPFGFSDLREARAVAMRLYWRFVGCCGYLYLRVSRLLVDRLPVPERCDFGQAQFGERQQTRANRSQVHLL